MKRQNNENMTIQFLQKKYQQEKQILLKENKRLKHNLQQQIERAHLFKIKSEQLQRENQNLNATIIQNKKQHQQESTYQNIKEQHFQLMREYHELIKKYNALLSQNGQLQTLVQKIHNQKVNFEDQLKSFRNSQNQVHSELQILANKHNQYKNQSINQIEQLQSINRNLQEEVERLNNKASQQKRKNKQIEKKVGELQKRLTESQKAEEERFKKQQQQIERQRNSLYEANLQFNSKYKLLQAKCSQIENRADQLQIQLKEYQKKAQFQKDNAYQLKIKLQKNHKIIQELQQDIQRLRQENKALQNQKNTVPKQDFMRQMKKNLTDINQMSQKNLQKFVEGPTIRQYSNESQSGAYIKQDMFERNRLQGKINVLQNQVLSYKRNIQSLSEQLRNTKRIIESKQYDIQKRQAQTKEIKQKLEKEYQRGKQLLALRKQNQNLRGKETEMIQRAKQIAQYQTSISLKLAFYQRKIKQNLDSIDRKDSIIEKHKITISDLEESQKYYQQTLKKLSDEADSLKGYKQECNRKDILLKEYKAKNDKLKQDKQDLAKDLSKIKADMTKLRNDKQRFQTQLQIKQKQLSTLKAKNQKLTVEKNDQYYKENSRLKQNKNATQQKLKQLKRQKQELLGALNQIRLTIISKVQQYLAKQIPIGKKKNHQYEAAKLLGLKAADLDQFLNPGTSLNRRITVQLQQLWSDGNYTQCLNSFINYITVQAQAKEKQN